MKRKTPRKRSEKGAGGSINSTRNGTSQTLRLEWLDADQLTENPANWRRHSGTQTTALQDVLAEVGWAGALLYNERTKRLVDGHLRKAVAKGQKVPVLVGDWSEDQERKILATLDPIAALATADKEKLDALLREVQTESEALAGMLTQMAEQAGIVLTEQKPAEDQSGQLKEQFQILVICQSEQQQAELLERFTEEGLVCRSLLS